MIAYHALHHVVLGLAWLQQARDEEYLARYLMADLPPLGDRVQQIRQGKAATLSSDNERNFARSQVRHLYCLPVHVLSRVALALCRPAALGSPQHQHGFEQHSALHIHGLYRRSTLRV